MSITKERFKDTHTDLRLPYVCTKYIAKLAADLRLSERVLKKRGFFCCLFSFVLFQYSCFLFCFYFTVDTQSIEKGTFF